MEHGATLMTKHKFWHGARPAIAMALPAPAAPPRADDASLALLAGFCAPMDARARVRARSGARRRRVLRPRRRLTAA